MDVWIATVWDAACCRASGERGRYFIGRRVPAGHLSMRWARRRRDRPAASRTPRAGGTGVTAIPEARQGSHPVRGTSDEDDRPDGDCLAATIISARGTAQDLARDLARVRIRDLARHGYLAARVRASHRTSARASDLARALSDSRVPARARDLATDAARAADFAHGLAQARDSANHLTALGAGEYVDHVGTQHNYYDLANSLARILERARDLVRVLPALARDLAPGGDLARARDFADALSDPANRHGGTGFNREFDRPLVRVHASVTVLIQIIFRDLARVLDGIAVDACGADLTGISFHDREALAGVVWSDQTRWPARLGRWARKHSSQIGPGRYRMSSEPDVRTQT